MFKHLNIYIKRIRHEQLAKCLPMTDLFAPAVPEEHVLYDILKPLLSYVYSTTPPKLPNTQYYYNASKYITFPWSIQIDGPQGWGKTALLRCMTRQSILYALPDRQPTNVDVLYNRQIDERTFISAYHAQVDKIINVQQMTATSMQMNSRFEAKRRRKHKNTLDSQLFKKELQFETVDINESPLEQNQDLLSVFSIDDCQYFAQSDLEQHFKAFYRGGQIRPIIIANNITAMSYRRYQITNKKDRLKSQPMMSYCYANAWSEETSAYKENVQPVKTVCKGKIDAFISSTKKQQQNQDNIQPTMVQTKMIDYLQYGVAIEQETTSQQYYKYNFGNTNQQISDLIIKIRDNINQLNRWNRDESSAVKYKDKQQPVLESNILKRPFFCIQNTKDHLTPIPCNSFLDLTGQLLINEESSSDEDDDLILDKQAPEFAPQQLIAQCAKQNLIACVFFSQFQLQNISTDEQVLQLIEPYSDIIEQAHVRLLSLSKSNKKFVNLRKYINYCHFLIDIQPNDLLQYIKSFEYNWDSNQFRNQYAIDVYDYILALGRAETTDYLLQYNEIPYIGYMQNDFVDNDKLIIAEFQTKSLYGREMVLFDQLKSFIYSLQ